MKSLNQQVLAESQKNHAEYLSVQKPEGDLAMQNILKLFSTFLLFLLVAMPGFSQDVEIPESTMFGGLEINFTSSARKILKTEVENLRRNPKYFQMKVERADLYFPLIEKVFAAEGFPEDFKYLALQESSLVPDAVSTSNAVGYWQFKKESAQEVGLRVDNEVDERMNIIAASLGAVKYLNRNNAVLKNWIYALLSYNMGLGGVRKEVDDKYIGATYMKIDDNMHWYVLRFLAHKFAFEKEVGKTLPKARLYEFQNCQNKSLSDIAGEIGLTEGEVVSYNKWLLKRTIPNDKDYVVILPINDNDKKAIAFVQDGNSRTPERKQEAATPVKRSRFVFLKRSESDKNKEKSETKYNTALITFNNKLKVLKAKEGDTFEKLASSGGITIDDFVLYNEVKKNDKAVPGTLYYLQAKRNKALIEEHVVQTGETVWQIAQLYGIRSGALRKKNKLKLKEEPKPGRIVLLRKKLKKGETPRFENVEPVKSDEAAKVQPDKATPAAGHVKDLKQEESQQPVISKTDYIILEDDPENATVVTDSAEYLYHTVQPGETMYSLSKKYSVTADSINTWNKLGGQGLKASSIIVVGRKMKTAEQQTPQEADFIIHTVQPGETMYRVSKLYGKAVGDIQKWNNKTDSSVSVGEKLKIQQP